VTDVPLSKDTIPLDVEACIERLAAAALRSDPASLEREEGRTQVTKEIEALRQEVQQTLTPHARPTRVACKRCYFRMAHAPPMWRDFCLLGLVRHQCGAIAFISDITLWQEVETRIRALYDHPHQGEEECL
jgi:hypothetical protein